MSSTPSGAAPTGAGQQETHRRISRAAALLTQSGDLHAFDAEVAAVLSALPTAGEPISYEQYRVAISDAQMAWHKTKPAARASEWNNSWDRFLAARLAALRSVPSPTPADGGDTALAELGLLQWIASGIDRNGHDLLEWPSDDLKRLDEIMASIRSRSSLPLRGADGRESERRVLEKIDYLSESWTTKEGAREALKMIHELIGPLVRASSSVAGKEENRG